MTNNPNNLTTETQSLNPNIPEAVRAVAADGTQLRYALIELSAQYKDAIAL